MRCGQHLLFFGFISMHFRVFSLSESYRMGDILGFAKISNTFLGA